MSKATQIREEVFAHAVALDQAGRLKNTIYAIEDSVFIMNSDSTIILRFQLPKGASFPDPVSFKANDYDGSNFYVEDGKIVFETKSGDFLRKKKCSTIEVTPEQIKEVYENLAEKEEIRDEIVVNLDHKLIPLLEEGLSHVEFVTQDDDLHIIQRNIYDGTVIDIQKTGGSGFDLQEFSDNLEDFGPFGMKTNDLIGLFSFVKNLRFTFEAEAKFCRIVGRTKTYQMEGLVAFCQYDELGKIGGVEDGRKKQKDRGSKQKSDKKVGKGRRTVR